MNPGIDQQHRIGQRQINRRQLLATQRRMSRAAAKKEWNIASQLQSHPHQLIRTNRDFPEQRGATKHRSRIGASTAQPSPYWNPFYESDINPPFPSSITMLEQTGRTDAKIFLSCLQLPGPLDPAENTPIGSWAEPDLIAQINGSEHSIDIMISVASATKHFQSQIDLGWGSNP